MSAADDIRDYAIQLGSDKSIIWPLPAFHLADGGAFLVEHMAPQIAARALRIDPCRLLALVDLPIQVVAWWSLRLSRDLEFGKSGARYAPLPSRSLVAAVECRGTWFANPGWTSYVLVPNIPCRPESSAAFGVRRMTALAREIRLSPYPPYSRPEVGGELDC